MDILINVIFNKASNTMDEKIRIVSITIYYYSLCSHSVLSTYYIFFLNTEQNRGLFIWNIEL